MRPNRALATVFAAALVAACTSSTGGGAAATDSAPPAAASSASSPAPSASSGYDSYGSAGSAKPAAGGMALAKTSLGTVLVGPTGMTLYMFLPDTATSSACTGACATTWPPLTGALPTLGAGLDKANFGSITRADGTKQVTFFGHPLYYYSSDKAAGDTKGEGLAQKWYVLGSDGKPIK